MESACRWCALHNIIYCKFYWIVCEQFRTFNWSINNPAHPARIVRGPCLWTPTPATPTVWGHSISDALLCDDIFSSGPTVPKIFINWFHGLAFHLSNENKYATQTLRAYPPLMHRIQNTRPSDRCLVNCRHHLTIEPHTFTSHTRLARADHFLHIKIQNSSSVSFVCVYAETRTSARTGAHIHTPIRIDECFNEAKSRACSHTTACMR